jgi:LmbE family N-acetylglucosaminyl deacetylase
VREWNPQTWELGRLYEIKIDKNEKANKLSQLLSENIYTHIHPDHLQCCKITVSMMKNFKRGELLLRRWNRLKN